MGGYSMTPFRIVVVDDHALFRRGLVGLLSEMPEFEVVGEAADGHEVLELINRTNPDLILLDVNMPVMDGIATVQALRQNGQTVKIIMLTISKKDDDLLGAIKAGADGYLLKNTEPEDLRKSIIKVAVGQGVLSPEVTEQVFKAIVSNNLDASQPLLSDREMEVLNCLANGLTTLQIAAALFISENTVKTHIRHILEKLDASNRTEAVSKGLQMGLIQKKN